MADRALGADLGFGLGKAEANITKGAVGVIGQAFDNYHAIAGPVTLVACSSKFFRRRPAFSIAFLITWVEPGLLGINQVAQKVASSGLRLWDNVNFTPLVHPGFGIRCFCHGLFAVLVGSAHC